MSGTFGMTILIDWGTDTLRWSAEDESFSMPNLAVSVSNRQKVCAVGNEAATLLREHPEFHALVPPRGILFADTEAIIAQLHEIRQQTVREKPWWKRLLLPRIFAAVPLGTTEFEAHGFRCGLHPVCGVAKWRHSLLRSAPVRRPRSGYGTETILPETV